MADKLRALGIDPGTNPRATWEGLDDQARQAATTAYGREHPEYRGGGRLRPSARKPPRKPRRARKTVLDDGTTIYWSSDLAYLAQRIREADRNVSVLVLAKLYGRDKRTNKKGWRDWWVGDPNKYWEAFPLGPSDERNPIGKVQVTIGRRAIFRDGQRETEGGYYNAWQYQEPLAGESRRVFTSRGPGGPFARMCRRIVNEGGF